MSLPTSTMVSPRPTPGNTRPKVTSRPTPTPPATPPTPLRIASISRTDQTRHDTSDDTRYQRGDIWMVVDDPAHPPVGTELWSNRPAIIVSNNVTGNHCGFVQVVYLTTSARKRSGPTHVMVPAPMQGRNQPQAEAMVLCEQIHTVDVSRLSRPLGSLSRNRMHEIDQAIALTLSIGRNPDSSGLFKKWEKYIQLHGIDMASEIQALAGHTTDQRVEALSRALELVNAEREAYKRLYEAGQQTPAALRLVQEIVTGPMGIVRPAEQTA